MFHSESSLISVPFHVARGRQYISDLKKEDVELLEDGHPADISFFEGGGGTERTPVEIGILFDTSGSMAIRGLLNPKLFQENLLDGLEGVRLVLYRFDEKLWRMTEPTRDVIVLKSAFDGIVKKKGGVEFRLLLRDKHRTVDAPGTSLIYESAYAALRDLARAEHSAAQLLVIVSDGIEEGLGIPEDAAVAGREGGISVYPLLLGRQQRLMELSDAGQNGDTTQAKSRLTGLHVAENLANNFVRLGPLTGGNSFEPSNLDSGNVRRILQSLTGEVRSLYFAGIHPPETATPHVHKLQIRLRSNAGLKLLGGERVVRY